MKRTARKGKRSLRKRPQSVNRLRSEKGCRHKIKYIKRKKFTSMRSTKRCPSSRILRKKHKTPEKYQPTYGCNRKQVAYLQGSVKKQNNRI